MKTPVLVLGLILGAFLVLHTLIAVVVGLGLGDEGALRFVLLGFGVALLWLIGVAFVVPTPSVAVYAFGFAALLAAIIGFTLGSFFIWAILSVLLAILSFRAGVEQDAERDRRATR